MHRMSFSEQRLTLTMLKQNIFCFENSVDLDQLASMKPADQDLHCFPLCFENTCKYLKTFELLRYKMRRSVVHENN